MKNKKIVVGVIAIAMLIGGILFAQDACFAGAITAPTGTGLTTTSTSIAAAISSIIKKLATFIGGLSVLMIVVSGIMYMVSGGDSGKVETAKNTLMYSIVGLVVALLAWVIVKTVIGAV